MRIIRVQFRAAIRLGWLALWLAGIGLFFLQSAPAGTNTEFHLARRYADEMLNAGSATPNRPALRLLFEDAPDAITRGRSWRGTAFQLGEKTFAHGLAFNSTKHFQVLIGEPAERFTGTVGLENNDDTRRGAPLGNGSVVFHVLLRGKEVFTSKLMRLADGGLPLDVPLAGATEFEIRVTDGGDGRGWDQALWGEAVVSLRSGGALRLQDLPLADRGGGNPFGFSFRYHGEPSSKLLANWQTQTQARTLDPQRESRIKTYRDPAGGLEVRVEAIQYQDFPAVEWVVYLQNTGTTNTPVLESIQALDGELPVALNGAARLHWAKGGVASFDDFAPQETVLKAGGSLRLHPEGGRSSNQVLPFFNLAGAAGGVVLAVGWTGEWAAEFRGGPSGQPQVQAGMAHTRISLQPGEVIRTPRMLVLFYEGDPVRGQNLLRKFILAHHRPQRGGRPLVPPITCGNWGGTAAAVHLDNIRQIIEHDLPLDYYWIDAEWYGHGAWPVNVGDWSFKQELYPQGFKPLSDALRRSGRELMLWFEPERVFKGTPWHWEHHDWLLEQGGENALWNLGHPEARKFLTDFISARVDEFGLGCYRQDFNIDPLEYWRRNDATDREGITEIRYIEGLYAFWDELLARHPNLIIDNCASGGRRLDLETVGRATPFWRTDGPRDSIAHQCHTYGLMSWIPLSATSQDRAGDDYEFRSSMCSSLCLNWWVAGDVPAEAIPANFPFDWAGRTLQQYVSLRPFWEGDYYPLTGYSQSREVWMAYQLDRPDLGSGLVVVLRRPDSPYESARLRLQGLDSGASYQIKNLDSGEAASCTALELALDGLGVVVRAKPGSALLKYERIPN